MSTLSQRSCCNTMSAGASALMSLLCPPFADGKDILFLLLVGSGVNLPSVYYGNAESVCCYVLLTGFPAGRALELMDCIENAADVRERGKGRTAV